MDPYVGPLMLAYIHGEIDKDIFGIPGVGNTEDISDWLGWIDNLCSHSTIRVVFARHVPYELNADVIHSASIKLDNWEL